MQLGRRKSLVVGIKCRQFLENNSRYHERLACLSQKSRATSGTKKIRRKRRMERPWHARSRKWRSNTRLRAHSLCLLVLIEGPITDRMQPEQSFQIKPVNPLQLGTNRHQPRRIRNPRRQNNILGHQVREQVSLGRPIIKRPIRRHFFQPRFAWSTDQCIDKAWLETGLSIVHSKRSGETHYFGCIEWWYIDWKGEVALCWGKDSHFEEK